MKILLGQGDGTFGWVSDPSAVAFKVDLGDMNGDSRLDLVAARGTFVTVHPGNGDGSFQPGSNADAGSGAADVTVADLDGDGFMDVAAGASAGSIAVLLGNGDGTFRPRMEYVAGPGSALEAVDLSGDKPSWLSTLPRDVRDRTPLDRGRQESTLAGEACESSHKVYASSLSGPAPSGFEAMSCRQKLRLAGPTFASEG